MWQRLAKFVLKNRLVLLILLFACTGLMAFYASKIKLSYEFSKAIPTDNPKYQEYLSFKKKFGDDGTLLVIGVQTDSFFQLNNLNSF
jgi:predicted RND superfamily exporter protein